MTHRNAKLTQSARHHACVSCGNPNACWCHSNALKHGKGRGIKANDIYGFYGCLRCHDWFDNRSKTAPPSAEGLSKDDWFAIMNDRSLRIAREKGYL